jgi:hypothetical protein
MSRAWLAAPCLLLALVGPGRALAQGTEPTLTLEPASGLAGTDVTATGTGFNCEAKDDVGLDGPLTLLWDDDPDPLAQTVTSDDTGSFEAHFVVPADATEGHHEVTARCDDTGVADGHPFTVEAPAALDLVPTSGPPGDQVTVVGTDFDCDPEEPARAGPVAVVWDADTLGEADVDDDGSFSTAFVPPESAPGEHEVSARCTLTELSATASYTLEEGPDDGAGEPPGTAEPPDGGESPGEGEETTDGTEEPSDDTGGPDGRLVEPRSLFPISIAAPDEISLAGSRVVAAFGLALLLLVLVGFPAELFNKTLEENHDELRRYFGWLSFAGGSRLRFPSWVQMLVFCVVAGALLSFVDPTSAMDRKTVALGLGLMVAVGVTTLAYLWPGEAYRRRVSGERARLHALPAGLLLAGLLALLSRVAEFVPGYVYGLVAGYVVSKSLPARQEGRVVLLGALCALLASAAAWFAWLPIDHSADAGTASFSVMVVDAALAGTFVVGLETVLFGLVPLRFMDGAKLAQWSRWAWGSVFVVAAFGFMYVLFATEAQQTTGLTPGTLARMLALFVGFAALSLLFWGFFALRRKARPGGGPPR